MHSESAETQRTITPILNGWFVTDRQRRIELKEGKTFHDTQGNVMFRLHEKRLTLSARIAISDSRGANIGHVRRKLRSFCPFAGRNQTEIIFGSKESGKFGTVKVDGMDFSATDCKAGIYLEDTWIGEVAGSWFMKDFTIYINKVPVAEILRTAETAEGGFSIITAAGVDTSFVLMIVMALGEIYGWVDSYNGGVASNILSRGASFSEHDRDAPNFNLIPGGRLG